MKVNIGKYPNWVGVYQIVDLLQKVGVSEDVCFNIAGYIVTKFPQIQSGLQLIYDNNERKVIVKIDEYDTWSADTTLALIILPVLKQLKDNSCSAPMVDLTDVPDYLRPHFHPTPQQLKTQPVFRFGYTDSYYFARWRHVLNEMIFAFTRIVEDDILENDMKSYNEVQARVQNGLRLFGKYYQSLWS